MEVLDRSKQPQLLELWSFTGSGMGETGLAFKHPSILAWFLHCFSCQGVYIDMT